MASDMSSMQELILVFVAKSHVWAQRIFLVYAIDTGCIMNLGPENLFRHQLASSKESRRKKITPYKYRLARIHCVRT
jgi:hypothetical protein